MKKIIYGLVAFISMSAFAQRSMVILEGYESGNATDRSVDFSRSNGGTENSKATNLALNYAFAITNAIQLGASFGSYESTDGGDVLESGNKYRKLGLYAVYNFSQRLTDTTYLSVGYSVLDSEDSDAIYDTDGDGTEDTDLDDNFKVSTWEIRLGHRFSLGNLGGMNFNYSPSVDLTFNTLKFASDLESSNQSNTSLTLNIVKFDVLF